MISIIFLVIMMILLLVGLYNSNTVHSTFDYSSLVSNHLQIIPYDEKLLLNSSRSKKVNSSVDLTPGLEEDLAKCNKFNMNGTVLGSYAYRRDILRAFIPPSEQFLTDFKNPCWYVNYTFPNRFRYLRYYDRRDVSLSSDLKLLSHFTKVENKPLKNLQCLPYFYLVGFPKCGTTALMYYIQKHPQYVPSCTKEPHWWGDYHILSEKDKDVASVLYYLKCFDEASQKIKQTPERYITGDGSTSTIWKWPIYVNDEDDRLACETPLLIEAIQPEAKYIVIIREPIDFLNSAFWYFCQQMKEKDPHTFHEYVERSLEWWNTCTQNYSTVQCVYNKHISSPDPGCGRLRQLVHPYIFVSIWLQVIPRKRMLFVKSEELKDNTADVMREVYKFLQLSALSDELLTDIVSVQHINEQKLLHKAENPTFQMLPSTRDLLLKFYKPFNKKLAKLLNDSRFLWKDVYD